ncbi:hypothetical protein K493DRAFT_381717 [Basidiobolus meristosporus CBS 931.73]|uniref:Uncharacterized protein n=1 Tax=Basidiobolus meristosporus CBS 931.73 TaxID=1314790 RepID=A0A1Y1XW65_9FUNG|nr:hypothetical protein K493DRAFT_381717 [Basidiobolus meristosporus CBS 931.73]|eukprot:ORX89990.1 hypothetical protein K493DRAFT_381717 [Basidiobolus meristosporus CBS 931.73]
MAVGAAPGVLTRVDSGWLVPFEIELDPLLEQQAEPWCFQEPIGGPGFRDGWSLKWCETDFHNSPGFHPAAAYLCSALEFRNLGLAQSGRWHWPTVLRSYLGSLANSSRVHVIVNHRGCGCGCECGCGCSRYRQHSRGYLADLGTIICLWEVPFTDGFSDPCGCIEGSSPVSPWHWSAAGESSSPGPHAGRARKRAIVLFTCVLQCTNDVGASPRRLALQCNLFQVARCSSVCAVTYMGPPTTAKMD